MQTRSCARLGREVSVIGLGTWQLGGDWQKVDDATADAIMAASVDAGVTLFDTADVYGDGRSESLIGQFLAGRPDITVFTKMGRRVEQKAHNYRLDNFRSWVQRSRENLGVETLDLVQLHCPPDDVYSDDAVFDALDTLVEERLIRAYGVSVETCDQALAAMGRPGVATVQIIINAFRFKPLDQVLPTAIDRGVAIIARVPLASGLLSGRFGHRTRFAADDHRQFNRHGEAFDVGETFSGVPYDVGVDAAQRFAAIARDAGLTAAQLALRWVLDQPGVTSVIPGASSAEQARGNAAVAGLPPLTDATLSAVRELYDEMIGPLVHDKW